MLNIFLVSLEFCGCKDLYAVLPTTIISPVVKSQDSIAEGRGTLGLDLSPFNPDFLFYRKGLRRLGIQNIASYISAYAW